MKMNLNFLKLKTKNCKPKTDCGFTLIEVLIYSALLALMMAGVLGAVYMIIQGIDKSSNRQLVDREANFIMRKLDWALSGVIIINSPASGVSGPTLSVTKTGFILPVKFRLAGANLEIDPGTGTYLPLDSGNVTTASLSFFHIPASGSWPAAIETSFYLNDRGFKTVKYIRK